ncbi:phospholipase C [Aspergillus sclerotialis]|uniref:Phosphoinositide phospholipase C n=1 Tax=Aspergillus sclerotialis TaxID=2070753 RepID=A0A3A2ZNS0_9EURO|nr:phospholipase C [Aspergillus sclerotialis]
MAKVNEITDHTAKMTLNPPATEGAVEVEPIRSFNPVIRTYLNQIYNSMNASPKGVTSGSESSNHPASLEDFLAYMSSPASAACRPAEKEDLSAPITEYFISSSHNTYLTGNQLYSDAAADAYTNVLLNGCRCVEIDVWDGVPHSDEETSSDSSSSSSSSEDRMSSRKKRIEKIEKKVGKKVEKEIEKGRSEAGTASSKLGHFLSKQLSHSGEASTSAETTATTSESLSKTPSRPEPRVLHGHTLTKGTSFREVCYAIRDSAFANNDLPVIVSLEVHACLEQQETMVEIIKEAWEGLLIDITTESEVSRMPALEDLKRKILVKVKWIPPTGDSEPEGAAQSTNHLEQHASQDSSVGANQGEPAPKKPSKILHALSRLAVYTKGYHFSHFTQPEAEEPGHVFSLSENAAKEAHTNHRDAFFEHNRNFFMRIYPFGLRVTSSNLDPSFFWRRGAQIVALNWQNLDKGMMLNQGMFADEQGWVRKPLGYRNSEDSPVRRNLDLSIEFFAAQGLPLPPGDTNAKGFKPYVVSLLHVEQPEDESNQNPQEDNSSDSGKSSYKRTIKHASGMDADFGAQKIVFPTVSGIVEELSFVRFKIKHEKLGPDQLAAWACIRLDRFQEGYRLIHLYDTAGSKTEGFLFVKVSKVVY